jgi:hypothetical protein
MATLKNTTINDTSAIQLPVGTTAQRPGSPANGYMRFNTTENKVEYYSSDEWKFLPTLGIVTDGLVLYLDAGNTASYPGSGTTWTDLSGNGNNGTLVNGVGYNSDNLGSLVFDGVNDYVSLPSINTNSNFTLNFWTKRTSNTNPTLFSGNPASGYLQIRNGSSEISLVKSFVAELGGFGSSTATTLNLISNITITKSGTTFSASVNGDFKNTLTVTETFTTTAPTLGINTSNSEPYTGNIYQFLVYNRTLSQQEIQQNFNATRSRFGL